MAISLKHLFQSAKTDGPDNTIVQPSDWNDEHVLTQATGKLLGRTTAGTGATEEIAPGTGITLSAGTLSADVTSVAGRTGAVTLSTADISGLTTGYVQKTSATGSAYLPAGTTGQREGSPAAGYIRYNTTTGKFEGYGSAWGNIGGGAAIGDTPPANPGAGDLWWNSADGRMYVYYTDANSSQWVDLSAGGAGQYLPLTGGTVSGNFEYTGTLTGGTGVINIGSGQFYKDASGNVGIGTSNNNVFDNVASARSLIVQSSSSATTPGSSTNSLTICNSDTTTNNVSQINFAAITGASTNQYSSAWIAAIHGARVNGQYPAGQLAFATSTSTNNAPSEKMRIDSSGNVLVGTTSTPTSMTNAVVAQSTAKAWIKLTDNGSTVTTNASFNISSVTRNATGSYTLNFTAALSSTNYCVVGGGGCNSTSLRAISVPWNTSGPATTYTPIQLVAADGVLGAATQYLCAAIFSASY